MSHYMQIKVTKLGTHHQESNMMENREEFQNNLYVMEYQKCSGGPGITSCFN